MATLEEDLEKYAKEAYYKKDLKAGLKLMAEISGIVAIGGLTLTALTVWMPAVGLPVTGYTVMKVIGAVSESYSGLSTEERKAVRAAVSWLKGGLTLERLID